MAPQLTVTKGLPARSPMPWMARATSSLPTPVSPSMSTGIGLRAAFATSCFTRSMPAERVMMSPTPNVPARRLRSVRTMVASSSSLTALRSETISRSGATGLTKKSAAPCRMAVTTVSSEELAVCTMTGVFEAFAGHGLEHRHAVQIGHDEVEHHHADALVGAQRIKRLLAAGSRYRHKAGLPCDLGGHPQLHGIVVDNNEDRPGFRKCDQPLRRIALCRFEAGWGAGVKRRLRLTELGVAGTAAGLAGRA